MNEEYPVTVGGFTGVGTDRLVTRPLSGMKFSTPDNDNDKHNVSIVLTVQLIVRMAGGSMLVTTSTSTNNHLM